MTAFNVVCVHAQIGEGEFPLSVAPQQRVPIAGLGTTLE